MSTENLDADEYMHRAAKVAVAGVSETLARHVGSLVGHETWSDENGHWLQVRAELEAFPDIEIRYARVVLAATGAELDAEGEASVFSSGFEERLQTRLHRTEPLAGVLAL